MTGESAKKHGLHVSRMVRKIILYPSLALAVVGATIGAYAFYLLQASLPVLEGTVATSGLAARAIVEFDTLGIPRIHAKNREDAFHVLGSVTARDRLFQMDLARRRTAGRLAEVLGSDLLESDRWHRVMGFAQVASAVYASLPADQQEMLRAYTKGVNQAITRFKVLPFEFLLLGYTPDAWRVEDSLLVVLGMYADLGWSADKERAATVMRAALPDSVLALLTPQTEPYTESLVQQVGELLPRYKPLPVQDLARLLQQEGDASRNSYRNYGSVPNRGSNAWVIGPSKTRDGRAILASDMHLALGVPNIWYRAEMHYGDTRLAGLTLPGVPLIITGSNQYIAWGFTGSGADVIDLVLVDVNPRAPSEYQTPQGMRQFGERLETIRIRGGVDESLVVRTTQWGPVLPEPLLGNPVAVHWIALDPGATNLDHANLDRVLTVQDALRVFNRAGGPVLNALVADAHGNIGWTLTGRIPVRTGMDGLYSHSWAKGNYSWRGYIPPEALPREVNPPSGFLVNANQRMVDARYPYSIGHSYEHGYRAYRIAERLRQMQRITEKDLLALQLDTQIDFYRYYQTLAIRVLGDTQGLTTELGAAALKRYLQAWDGHADLNSLGLGLLVEFREALLAVVLSPLLARCRVLDPKFEYNWNYPDVPLQRLLDARLPELLPNRHEYPDWDSFIRAVLEQSARRLLDRYSADSLDELTWGRINEALIVHPLSGAIPLIGQWLDMPNDPLPGCGYCVRAFVGDGGPQSA